MTHNKYIAHRRAYDQKEQSVCDHLQSVSAICGRLAEKVDMAQAGSLIGLLHDLGKYGSDFQAYIRSATGILNPDIDDAHVDFVNLRGKIDHSTAGAQWVWERCSRCGLQGRLVGQILAVCLASHHGGLLDCLRPDGHNGFTKRITKPDEKTHLQECLENMDQKIRDRIESLTSEALVLQCMTRLIRIVVPERKEESYCLKHFRIGFFTRFLFSCLIDADRIDSADFENPDNVSLRCAGPVNWQQAIDRLEEKLASFKGDSRINRIRKQIADGCLAKAAKENSLFMLTVPTGGGKTFSSMRFALNHARRHNLERIFYIIPFTSIIEQNVQVMRDVLENEDDPRPWILEHHSSLEPEQQTWQSKLTCENWDAPIIFTTMVQFLETLFGGGTRGVRRLHNLARAVIIFDEIQSLPINCVHLFCNALQFFVDYAGSTAVLCTATQPLLGGVNPDKGRLRIPEENRLVDDVHGLFDQLKRVEIVDRTCQKGWDGEEVTKFVLEQYNLKGNCLVIVNTKAWARRLYERCKQEIDQGIVVHLSASLCPAHRRDLLATVTERLDNELPILCISTQLIEAGVDVDFNCVIRFLAGLDSIAQAAGRCNRNDRLETAQVYVINPREESIETLTDIRIGREQAWRVLSEQEHDDLLRPDAMQRYFQYYFYERADIMTYPLSVEQAGRDGETMLNLLADNPLNTGQEAGIRKAMFMLQQSFKTAGRAFQAIDAPTRGVIVPHGRGRQIIVDLCAAFEPSTATRLLREAQQYSVNVFPNVWEKLQEAGALIPVQEGEEIYYLDEQFYSDEFGLSTEAVSKMDTQIC